MRRWFLQLCILEVRKEKKRWSAQETWREATRSGGNAAKTHRNKAVVLLAGEVDLSMHKHKFEDHWAGIMTSPSQAEAAAIIAPCRDQMHSWPNELAVDYELINDMISRLKPGRSGGEDGVAAEFSEPYLSRRKSDSHRWSGAF